MKCQDEEMEIDPFLCRCCKCQKFWADHFNSNATKMMRDPPHLRAAKSGCMYAAVKSREDHPAVLRIGDRVAVSPDQLKGVVKYLGPLDENLVSPELYVGVHLDNHVGSPHNGVVSSKRYFHCPRGHGLMVKYGDVVRVNPPEKKPPIRGNYMFPSFKEVQERRKARSLLDPELDLGPMYTANQSSRRGSKSSVGKHKDHTTKQGGSSTKKQHGSMEETRDYTKEPPRDLINRWNKEMFGGGREGEIKAKTLYKLQAAYQKGVLYREGEENGDMMSSEDSISDEDEDNDEDDEDDSVMERRRKPVTDRRRGGTQ